MNTISDAQKNGRNAFLHGDFEKAERLYKQGLAASSANASTANPAAVRETAELLHELGKLYATLAQYEKSEDFYSKAKSQLENALGIHHPRIAVTVREMAHLSWQIGRQDQFNALNRRAVELWRDFLVGTPESLPDEMPTFEALFALRQAKEGIENVQKMARSHAAEQAVCGIPFPVAAMLELGILYRSTGNLQNAKQFLNFALDECNHCNAGPIALFEATRQLATTLRLLGNTQESDTLFRQALSIYRELELDEFPDQAEIYFELAQNAETRGDLDEAERLYSASLGITERLFGAQHPQVAQALRRIASIHAAQGQVAAAEIEYKRAIDLLQQAFGNSHRDIGEIWDQLGRMYQVQRKYDEAEALYFRAIEIAGASQGPQPPQVAIYYDRLAEVYRHNGRFRKAETAHQRALGIRREAFIATHEEISATLMRLAKLYLDWGKFADADALFRSAAPLIKAAHGEVSEQAAACLVNIGISGRKLAKFKDAESALQQAITIYEQISPDSSSDASLIEPLIGLGQVASDLGRFKQAKSRFDHAEEIINAVSGETSKRAIALQKLQADLSQRQGNIEASEQLYRKVIDVIGKNSEKDPITLIESLCELGRIESRKGNNVAARELFDSAMRVASSLPAGDASAIVNILLAMAEHSLRLRVQTDALSYCKQALQQAERSCGQHHMLTAKCHCAIAEFLAECEQSGQAIEHYLSALQIMETTLGAFHPELATTLIALSRLWLSFGKSDNAETLLKRAVDIRERVLGSQNPDTLSALAYLADLYMTRGLTSEAKSTGDRIKLIWQENLTLFKSTPVDLLCVLIRGYARADRLDEALTLAEKELEVRSSIRSREDESIPLSLTIAELKLAHRKSTIDEATKQRWLALAETNSLSSTGSNGQACAIAAEILADRGETIRAFDYLEKGNLAFGRSLGKKHESTTRTLRKMADLSVDIICDYVRSGDLEHAYEFREKVVALREQIGKEKAERVIAALAAMAQVYEAGKEWAKMNKVYQSALDLAGASNNIRVAQYSYRIGMGMFRLGKNEEAIVKLVTSVRVQEQLEGRLSKGLLPALELLAELYSLTKKAPSETQIRSHIAEIHKSPS